MSEIELTTFYEKIVGRFPFPFTSKILVSLALGLIFIYSHYLSSQVSADQKELFDITSIFLAAIISAAMASLYLATHTLRSILPEMERRTKDGGKLFMIPLKHLLVTKIFLQYGVFFAVLNCLMATVFGIPHIEESNHPQYFEYVISLYFGYFLAGFVCGMAVLGILAVFKSLRQFGINARHSFDFTSPDNCGGTLFIGNALMIFASVTLFVGVLISSYIINTEWVNTFGLAAGLKIIWIIFPYFMSIVVFVGPALSLNKSLIHYKRNQDQLIRSKLDKLMHQIDNEPNVSNDDLVKKYEFNQKLREQLHKMRTWPYGLNTNSKYFSMVVVNSFAVYGANQKYIDKFLSSFG